MGYKEHEVFEKWYSHQQEKIQQEGCPTGLVGKMPLIVKVVFQLMFGYNYHIMRRFFDLSTDLDAEAKCFCTLEYLSLPYLLSQN